MNNLLGEKPDKSAQKGDTGGDIAAGETAD